MPNDHSSTHLNPGQQRKIRIIEKMFGTDWRTQYPDMAIDAVYNIAIHDDRKSLFCKIDKQRKEQLTEMLDYYDTTMGDFIGMMIDTHYMTYQDQRRSIISGIAEDFSGMKI
jgi:hypothetical protein